MIILSHRGYWLESTEKNKEVAFRRSFDLGFGTETDVRDRKGELVISHDMPNGNEMTLDDFLKIFGKRTLPLAMNIKADGLVIPLNKAMQAKGITDWFVFDMSIPDTRGYLQAGVPVFARMSEVEREPAWLDKSAGVWLDAFNGTWYDANVVDSLLKSGKRVCIVSPELHGRDYEPLWNTLLPLAEHPALMLCTDFPERAKIYFKEKQQ